MCEFEGIVVFKFLDDFLLELISYCVILGEIFNLDDIGCLVYLIYDVCCDDGILWSKLVSEGFDSLCKNYLLWWEFSILLVVVNSVCEGVLVVLGFRINE